MNFRCADFEPLTPTPMVVYERPPRTTPPAGKLEKANPSVVIVKHKDFTHAEHHENSPPLRNPHNEHGPIDLPIEDITKQQEKERAEHKVVTTKDEVAPLKDSQNPATTIVHITPDNGAPGGAASVVNEAKPAQAHNAAVARMVSLLPDNLHQGYNSPPLAGSYNPQANVFSRSAPWQQYAQTMPQTMPQTYQGYSYYPQSENAQTRSLSTGPLKSNWENVYNKLLQKRRNNYRVTKH